MGGRGRWFAGMGLLDRQSAVRAVMCNRATTVSHAVATANGQAWALDIWYRALTRRCGSTGSLDPLRIVTGSLRYVRLGAVMQLGQLVMGRQRCKPAAHTDR